MRKVSEELRERLTAQRGENKLSLPISRFVRVEWPLDADGSETAQRYYSTVVVPVTMDGNLYRAEDRLLEFEDGGEGDRFLENSDHLIYGASCGFHIPDGEGLARQAVARANERRDFPAIYCEAWLHFSDEADEIKSMLYGMMVFGGHATRIELRNDADGGRSAMVWGGHDGVVLAKSKPDTRTTASVLGRPLSWSGRVDRLLGRGTGPS